MVKSYKRFDIWLVQLNPTKGSEIAKTRPCIIISPDIQNRYLNTITVALLTHTKKSYPTRLDCLFNKEPGQIVIDQIRAVDKLRLVKKLGKLDIATSKLLCELLIESFKY
ncbi:type II toxin-antitoxin system PemK/MazF family toxin [uncultured Arcticibacterium sp.]|uniref:type II toxin-antitoxin system PemK/MazF family toxin n=1 Tax=uncultured Arcticibacterium sp. TaxID=2173042 RepID=UPI0030F55032